MKYNKYAFGIMIAIVSFLGFVVENLWLIFAKGYIDDRNMNLPFLLGYGILILMMYIIIGTPDELHIQKFINRKLSKRARYLLYFVFAFIIVCLGELILGITFEEVSGIKYWNYSMIPLHFTQYTSIPTSMGFATMITVFMGWIFDPLMEFISRMNPMAMKVVSIMLMTLLLSDFIISFYKMIKKRAFIVKWRIHLR